MDPRDIAVATITLARTDAEASLMHNAIARLASFGMPIAVADGGSSEAFISAVAGIAGVTVRRASAAGLVEQVKLSVEMSRAAGRGALLYTEPDKLDFFSAHLPRFLASSALDATTGIVLAARSPAALSTYPPFQQQTERVANDLCARLIDVTADGFYGPFLAAPALIGEVRRAPPSLGWGWRPFVFAAARRADLTVAAVEGEFECPADQRAEDDVDRRHRLAQLRQNIDGLLFGTTP